MTPECPEYEGRSWTKCSTRRFVMAIRRFVVSSCRFRRFVMAFRRFGTPISEVDSANYQFDSSAGLLYRFVVSSFRHVVSSFRYVVSSFRLVHSERL